MDKLVFAVVLYLIETFNAVPIVLLFRQLFSFKGVAYTLWG